jgi:hypothetical protein
LNLKRVIQRMENRSLLVRYGVAQSTSLVNGRS